MPYTLADTWKDSVLYLSLFKGSSSYGMNIFCINIYFVFISQTPA